MKPGLTRTAYPAPEEGVPEDPLERIEAIQARLTSWEDHLQDTVARARKDGYTWREIGRALGVTSKAALRFGDEG